MPTLEILDTTRIDERDSAFPQAVQLPDGDVLCSFSVGGGANVTGGTDWARSTDGGLTWTHEGTILPHDPRTNLANFLKLSLARDGGTVYAYGATIDDDLTDPFGHRDADAVLCRSIDAGRTWSPPTPVPMPLDCPLEVSYAALTLQSGRLLAPAGTLPHPDRLGEHVFVAISDDGGVTWPQHSVPFHDESGKLGFFEHKFAQLPSGRVLATAWTVTLGDYRDQPNSFVLSDDDGLTWGPVHSTGIHGQTMTPLPLGDDRLLVLYNRRHGDQAIVACLVTFNEQSWQVRHEAILYDAHARYRRPEDVETGIDELDSFAFGFPTAVPLQDGNVLATHWCVEDGVCGIRATRLRIDWP